MQRVKLDHQPDRIITSSWFWWVTKFSYLYSDLTNTLSSYQVPITMWGAFIYVYISWRTQVSEEPWGCVAGRGLNYSKLQLWCWWNHHLQSQTPWWVLLYLSFHFIPNFRDNHLYLHFKDKNTVTQKVCYVLLQLIKKIWKPNYRSVKSRALPASVSLGISTADIFVTPAASW